ncbi:MAG: hypothetical protein QXH37_06540 [Candidatus Bathyarchaeia archaeon]
MSEDLKNKLISEIEKSGYPLEIEISSILESKDWYVINNRPYVDSDEGKLRSIDISAFHATAFDFEKYDPLTFSPNLVVECKKVQLMHGYSFQDR